MVDEPFQQQKSLTLAAGVNKSNPVRDRQLIAIRSLQKGVLSYALNGARFVKRIYPTREVK